MADFLATLLAKIAANLLESLILRIVNALSAETFTAPA